MTAVRHKMQLLLVILAISAATALSAATTVVRIGDFFFDPTNLTVNLNDTVKWANGVATVHDSTQRTNLWASPKLSSTSTTNSFSFTFTKAGFYPYFCFTHVLGHPEQTGNVTVVSMDLPPVVSISSPTNGAAFFAPVSFRLQASASDSDGSVAQVEFFEGATSLGIATTNPYSLNLSGLAAGNYAFTAVAADNQNAKSTSSVVNVRVSAPPLISLGSVKQLSGGEFEFSISGGSAGQICVIDACLSLPNWTPVYTTNFPNTTCQACPRIDFTDTNFLTNGRRFYRARVSP